MGEAFHQLTSFGCPLELRDIRLNELLLDANRACRILRGLADTAMAASGLGYLLPIKATMHQILGQHASALAAFQEANEVLIAEEQKGNKTTNSNFEVLAEIGYVNLEMNQPEAAKRSFLRILARPGRIESNHRMNAYHGLARCHKERQDWVQTIKCAEDALACLPAARKILPLGSTEERLLLLLADAAEGQGDLKRAREYDEQVRKMIARNNTRISEEETVGAARRHALELLAAGKPHKAGPILTTRWTNNLEKGPCTNIYSCIRVIRLLFVVICHSSMI
jgi:tetratricopeptide (TPR) repeat protein